MGTSAERPLEWMKFDPVKVGFELEGMSFAEIGAYFTLVRHLWQFGPLPEDRVRRVTGEAFDAVRSRMIEMEGALSIQWLEEARAYGGKVRTQRIGAATESVKARKIKRDRLAQLEKANQEHDPTAVEQPLNDRSTSVLSLSSSSSSSKSHSDSPSERNSGRNRAKEIPRTAKVEDIRFEALWAEYGRLGSKPEAFRHWLSLPESDRVAIEAKLAAYVDSTPGGAFRKHLQGWINPKNRYWESAIVTHANITTNGQPTAEQRAANYRRILADKYQD